MPVKRRLGKARRSGWGDEHRMALGSGQRYLGAFGSHRDPWPMDKVREAWADLREGIMETFRRDKPTLRPWAWWTCELGVQPPHPKCAQRQYLLDHGHLTPAEVKMLRADASLLEPSSLDRWLMGEG